MAESDGSMTETENSFDIISEEVEKLIQRGRFKETVAFLDRLKYHIKTQNRR